MAEIDKIVIKEGGTTKTLTPAEWKAIPITQRVKVLGTAEFYAGGALVNAKEAVAQLR